MVILAAVDLEQEPNRPITVGHDLAAAFGDRLVVVTVVSEGAYERQRASTADLPREFQGNYTVDQASDRAGNQLTSVVKETLDAYDPARVETVGRVGDVASEVVALSEELDPRYVVVGGRNRSVARQALFGSVSQSIIRQVDQPVVTTFEPTA